MSDVPTEIMTGVCSGNISCITAVITTPSAGDLLSLAMAHGLAVLLIDGSILPDKVLEATTKKRLARTAVQILFKGVERR